MWCPRSSRWPIASCAAPCRRRVPTGRPRTRVLHPLWEWDGAALTRWIATSPKSPNAGEIASVPAVSSTYWSANPRHVRADCDAAFEGPAPVGYDPSIIPQWTSPDAEAFGILRLSPHRMRLMDGSVMTEGSGRLLKWKA